MINLIFWLLFGGLIGWIVIIMTEDSLNGHVADRIVLGMFGGLVGGVIGQLMSSSHILSEYSSFSFVLSICGALGLMAVYHIRLHNSSS